MVTLKDRTIQTSHKKAGFIFTFILLSIFSLIFLKEATAFEGIISYGLASDSFFYKINANVEGIESDTPTVQIISPKDYVRLNTNPIDLNFTVTKKPENITSCDVLINNQLIFTNLTVNNGITAYTYTPLELTNTVEYKWNVNCSSEEDNFNAPSEASFYTDLQFTVTTDKEVYKPGENVIVTLNAPQNSNVRLKSIPQSGWIVQKDINGTYPQNVTFSNTETEGDYTLTAELKDYLEQTVRISKLFTVSNPILSLSFTSNVSEIDQGESVKFTATVENATGTINYVLEYGDGTSAVTTSTTDTQWSQEHAFTTDGTYPVNVTITNNGETRTAVLNIEVDLIDTTAPVIELVEPANDYTSTTDSAVLKYKAYDRTNMKCYLYLTSPVGEGWSEKKLEDAKTGVVNDSVRSVVVSHLSDGKYMWEVNCTDADDNSALSESRSFTISTGATPTLLQEQQPAEVNESALDEEVPEIEKVIAEINDLLKKFEGFDTAQKESLEDLNVISSLETAKMELRRISRDLNNVKFRRDLDDAGKLNRTQDLLDNIKTIRGGAVSNIKVLESKEYVKYSLASNLADVISKYAAFKGYTLTKSQVERFVQKIKEMQSFLTVSTKAKQLEIEYLSGEKKDITLINKQMTLDNESYTLILEVLPKEVAKSTDDIVFLSGEPTVIEKDPVLQLDLSKSKNVVYYIKGYVSLGSLEDIDSILIIDPSNVPKDTNFITGLATFSKDNLGGLDLKWSILISVFLSIVLSLMVFGLDVKHRFINFGGILYILNREEARKIKYLDSTVSHAFVFVKGKQADKASLLYEEALLAYNSLSQRGQDKVYNRIVNLCNEIDAIYLLSLVDEAMLDADKQDYDLAYFKYEQVQSIYKRLPEKHQSKIYEKCALLINRLNAQPMNNLGV